MNLYADPWESVVSSQTFFFRSDYTILFHRHCVASVDLVKAWKVMAAFQLPDAGHDGSGRRPEIHQMQRPSISTQVYSPKIQGFPFFLFSVNQSQILREHTNREMYSTAHSDIPLGLLLMQAALWALSPSQPPNLKVRTTVERRWKKS